MRDIIGRGKIGMTAVLCCIAFYFFAPGFFDGVERGVLPWMYGVRGEGPLDTSVVVLALTADDIDALGGLPVKRSYYALALNALGELGARVVGVDLGLTDAGTSAPEYNDLLASVIRSEGNVVMSGYFRSLSAPRAPGEPGSGGATEAETGFPARFAPRLTGVGPWRTGYHFIGPYAPFLEGASGLGHTNLTDDLSLPLFIGPDSSPAPLFSLEVLRRSMDGEVSVSTGGGTATLTGGSESYTIPYDRDGDVKLNFTGGTSSLRMFSFLEFLRAYDERGSGRAAPAADVRGKIVLIGVVAEGRSSFVDSPFGSAYPAIGLHALFLDNALHDRFLRSAPPAAVAIVLIMLGIAASVMVSQGRAARGVLGVFSVVGLYTALSFVLFANASYVMPQFVCWFTAAVLVVTLLVSGQRAARGRIATLESEKQGILATVREKERQIDELQREFETLRDRGEGERSGELAARMEEYREEIGRLKRLSRDLEPYGGPPAAVPAGRGDGGGPGGGDDFGIVHDPSGAMAPVVALVRKIAASDATVLITGESGSGKELVARALHLSSSRREQPFVAVNCGALSETLLESELFGHEKGAFTGAVKERQGRFEAAGRGTIFLDEIGETAESFQVKLLRVLQDGTFERVGGTATLTSGARVVTATNRDLKGAVEAKTFRADLYYRLNVLAVDIPPLRARPGDIPLLAAAFLREEGPGLSISESVAGAFASYGWPGNVRELQSAVKRGALLARADGRTLLRLRDLPDEISAALRDSGDVGERVIRSMREKGFSRNAISETADDIGGFNRGTVAEYFRGYCFEAFEAEGFDRTRAVERIAGAAGRPGGGSVPEEVAGRIEKKLSEYLQNAVEFVDPAEPIGQVLEKSKPKFKNLPKRYHPPLERIIAAARRGEWKP